MVKVWAFGHTHFSCQFVDEGDAEAKALNGASDEARSGSGNGGERRKLVVANQKGYAYSEGKGNWEVVSVVVGKEGDVWKVLVGCKDGGQERC